MTKPYHIDCNQHHWYWEDCDQGLKTRIWSRFLTLAGWLTFWRNGNG